MEREPLFQLSFVSNKCDFFSFFAPSLPDHGVQPKAEEEDGGGGEERSGEAG